MWHVCGAPKKREEPGVQGLMVSSTGSQVSQLLRRQVRPREVEEVSPMHRKQWHMDFILVWVSFL